MFKWILLLILQLSDWPRTFDRSYGYVLLTGECHIEGIYLSLNKCEEHMGTTSKCRAVLIIP